jgi:hypothetical protein
MMSDRGLIVDLFPTDNCGTKRGMHSLTSAGIFSMVAMFAGVSSDPAAAQNCIRCQIPSGYTTLRGVSHGSCRDQLVVCTCDGVKSQQYLCLYVVAVGGNLHSVLPPPTATTLPSPPGYRQ